MADPGSTIGVVSLALQVFQGLAKYYEHFKSFDDNISHILLRIERFQGTLSALEAPIHKLQSDDTVSKEIRLSITACEDVLAKLEEYVKKCNEVPVPGSQISRLILFKNRALFPFRKAALRELDECLDDMQGILGNLVQALQLKTIIQIDEQAVARAEKADSRLDLISKQNNTFHHKQTYQTQLLKAIDTTARLGTERAAKDTLQIQNDIDGLALQFQQFQILQQNMADRFSLLESLAQSFQMQRLPAPSAIEEGVEARYDLAAFMRKIRIKQKQRKCSCKAVSKDPGHLSRFRFYWNQTCEHQQSCPNYTAAQYLDAIGAYTVYYSHMMATIVRFGIEYRRGAGGISISPCLKTYRVIHHSWSEDSLFPVSMMLIDQGFAMHRRQPTSTAVRETEMIQRRMEKGLSTGSVSPLDITETGENYLQRACYFISGDDGRLASPSEALRLVRFLIEAAVPIDNNNSSWQEDQGYKRPLSPLEGLLYQRWKSNPDFQEYLCSYLIERGAQWTLDFGWAWKVVTGRIVAEFHWLVKLLEKETFREAYCGGPLHIAILHKSTPELLESLRMPERGEIDAEQLETLLIMSANWSEGLQILLTTDFGYASRSMDSYKRLWAAFQWQNHESIKVFLNAGTRISSLMWEEALFYHGNDEVLQGILDFITDESLQHHLIGFDLGYIYHSLHLRVECATRLFQAGFCNLDYYFNPSEYRRDTIFSDFAPGPPFWFHAFHAFVWFGAPLLDTRSMINYLHLLRWLNLNCANPAYLHPALRTTAIHLVGGTLNRRLGRKASVNKFTQSLKVEGLDEYFATTLISEHNDDCDCACSSDGCYPIVSAFKSRLCKESSANSLNYVISLMENVLATHVALAIAVIRVLSFEELGIRHTCHDGELVEEVERKYASPCTTVYVPRTKEEIAELHEEDQYLIDRLENLMIEFEKQFSGHEGTFQEFIDGDWRKRMDEELGELEEIKEKEIQGIRRTGVVLWEPYGPQLHTDFRSFEP